MVSNCPKTHFLWPVDPLLAHFGWFPLVFWGSRGLFGVQNCPKGGQNCPKGGQKWPKMVKISKKIRFSVSLRNALKWYPNGLKLSQNTFLWPVDPLLAHFGWFPLAFWGSRGLLGVQNGPKIAQKGAKMAQKGAKNGPKWPKMVKISKKNRFSVSAGNALKWYPNGLKRSQNTF